MATNNGSATTYPIFKATGPGRLYQLANRTTGDEIFFDLLLNAGETVLLDLRPGKKTFTSTFRGNIIHTVVAGSDLATFRLVPGENEVAILIDDATATASLQWDERHWSVDGGG